MIKPLRISFGQTSVSTSLTLIFYTDTTGSGIIPYTITLPSNPDLNLKIHQNGKRLYPGIDYTIDTIASTINVSFSFPGAIYMIEY